MKVMKSLIVLSGLLQSLPALAAGGATFISYYSLVLGSLGLSEEQISQWVHVLGAAFTTLIVLLLGFHYKKSVEAQGYQAVPDSRLNLKNIIEMILEFVHNLARNVIGDREARPYLSALFAIFIFIFISNLSGLVPGFTPATESLNTNLVLGLFSFAVFNLAGIREHGVVGYLKTYCGPLLFMAPFIFFIEIIGALARPVSLALRLYGNIFGDHLVLSVFTGLTYLLLPSLLLFFGLLVASIQSFVFTLLSSIYISLAVSHDH